VLKTSISGTNISKLADITPFTGASFINDCLLQATLQLNHPLLQFADITDPLSEHCFFPDFIVVGFSFELLWWPHILQDKF